MPKFLYQPVYPFHLNQKFGENSACYNSETKKVITCNGNKPPKGYRSLYGAGGHKGIDLRAGHGQEVYCAATGVIDSIDTDPKSGLDVRIRTDVDGVKYLHIYEHLLGYHGKKGDLVFTGQIVGWADNTGWSSGNHLHFELKKKKGTRWVSVDPLPLMTPLFARTKLLYSDKNKWIREVLAKILDSLQDRLRKKDEGTDS